MNRAEFWSKTIELAWDVPEVCNSISDLFRTYDINKILDCACGTGEFTIELAKKGFDIDCSDGDELMLDIARKNIMDENLTLNPIYCKWDNLLDKFKENSYDTVMIRGNSLTCGVGWDNEDKDYKINKEKAEENLLNCFKNIFKLLKKGGIFYFDIPNINETEGEHFLNNENKGLQVSYDVKYIGDLRQNISKLIFKNKIVDERVYNTLRISVERIKDLLVKAGFKEKDIKINIPIKGENVYTACIAQKT